MYPSDDRVVIAWYSEDGTQHTTIWDFGGHRPCSRMRAGKVAEYERFKEALKGQGADVHVWDIHHWSMYAAQFRSGKLRRKS